MRPAILLLALLIPMLLTACTVDEEISFPLDAERWIAVELGTRTEFRDIFFIDEHRGWIVGGGHGIQGGMIGNTADGGATWDGPLPLDPAGDKSNFTRGTAIHFLDPYRGILVGRFGLIRLTLDGGLTWTKISTQESEKPDLWGVDFADDLHGWAVGERGTILHTGDGGKTWKRQSSGVADILMDVDFIDASTGRVVGFDSSTGSSAILHTTDGGATWTEQTRVVTELLDALFVLDDRHAWAVGRQQRFSDADGTQKLMRYEVVTAD